MANMNTTTGMDHALRHGCIFTFITFCSNNKSISLLSPAPSPPATSPAVATFSTSTRLRLPLTITPLRPLLPRGHLPLHAGGQISHLLAVLPQQADVHGAADDLLEVLGGHHADFVALGEHDAVVADPPLEGAVAQAALDVDVDEHLGVAAHAADDAALVAGQPRAAVYVVAPHALQAARRRDQRPEVEVGAVHHHLGHVASLEADGPQQRFVVHLDAVALVGADEPVRRVRRALV